MPPGIGDPAPLFSGADVLTGQPFSLADQQGSVVLVAFNGITWCPPCQFEAPVLQALSEEFQVGVQFIMVASLCDVGELPNALENFGVTFPTIGDPAGQIAGDYGVVAYPTLFVLKNDLTICAIKVGVAEPSFEDLKEAIGNLLEDCGAPELIPKVPIHEWVALVHILFGVVQDGGGVVWPGGKIPPWSPLRRLAPEVRETLLALGVHQLSQRIGDRRVSQRLQLTAIRAAQSALAALDKRVEFEQTVEQKWMAPPRGRV
jgi:peroxiredoxin